jgi:hypothetical protein
MGIPSYSRQVPGEFIGRGEKRGINNSPRNSHRKGIFQPPTYIPKYGNSQLRFKTITSSTKATSGFIRSARVLEQAVNDQSVPMVDKRASQHNN